MEKVSKAIMRAFGAKPNGSDKTSCVNDWQHVKQLFLLLGIAFTAGAMSFGYQGLPERVKAVEAKVVRIEAISQSIDDRLARIENALIRR